MSKASILFFAAVALFLATELNAAVEGENRLLVYKYKGVRNSVETVSGDQSQATENVFKEQGYLVVEFRLADQGYENPMVVYLWNDGKSKYYRQDDFLDGDAVFRSYTVNSKRKSQELITVSSPQGGYYKGYGKSLNHKILGIDADSGESDVLYSPLQSLTGGINHDTYDANGNYQSDAVQGTFKLNHKLTKKLNNEITPASGAVLAELGVEYLVEQYVTSKRYQEAAATPTRYPRENLNIVILKDQITNYYDSGQYDKDMATIGAQAMEVLESYKDQEGKFALVFDIDDTCIFHWKLFKDCDFAVTDKDLMDWTEKNSFTVIQPSLDLYNKAKEKEYGFSVFFISFREENLREITKVNLNYAGFSGWTELYLKPDDLPDDETAQAFKTQKRKEIEEAGYTIIISVGDQHSDVNGGYSENIFKLPNQYFFKQ